MEVRSSLLVPRSQGNIDLEIVELRFARRRCISRVSSLVSSCTPYQRKKEERTAMLSVIVMFLLVFGVPPGLFLHKSKIVSKRKPILSIFSLDANSSNSIP